MSISTEPQPQASAAGPARPSPYIGPRAFKTGETLYGREREVMDLLDLLIAERIVLLYSPSGAGKTSLVQAALIPQLEAEGFAVLPVIRVSVEPPQPPTTDHRPPTADRRLSTIDHRPPAPSTNRRP